MAGNGFVEDGGLLDAYDVVGEEKEEFERRGPGLYGAVTKGG